MLDLDNNYMYHAPSENKQDKYHALRGNLKSVAKLITVLVPEGREQSIALTKIEEAMFWANAGVARDVLPCSEPKCELPNAQ